MQGRSAVVVLHFIGREDGGSVMRTDNRRVGELYGIQCFYLRRGKETGRQGRWWATSVCRKGKGAGHLGCLGAEPA
jgi:hypothetical protein